MLFGPKRINYQQILHFGGSPKSADVQLRDSVRIHVVMILVNIRGANGEFRENIIRQHEIKSESQVSQKMKIRAQSKKSKSNRDIIYSST